jgi:hypothetical protein
MPTWRLLEHLATRLATFAAIVLELGSAAIVFGIQLK